MAETSSEPEVPRRRRLGRMAWMLVLALLLLLLALALSFGGQPGWEADGSREAYPALLRAAVFASLGAAIVLGPLGLRELVLALLPIRVLATVLAVVVGLTCAVALPIGLWAAAVVTGPLEAGSREGLEHGDDWDWD